MTTSSSRRRAATLAAGTLTLIALAVGVRLLAHPAQAADAPAHAAPAPVRVTTAEVRTQDVPVYRSGIGTVAAMASVTVKPRIDGQLERVGFTEGQDVTAGQVLARIDPRTLQAQLAQAQAQQARDAAQLGNARADLARYTRLIGEDAATQQQVDTQKALVAQLDAAVQTDAAQVHYAQVQLGFATITAPISGRVGARLVDPGNIVHAADAGGLVVINQVDPISVTFTLPEEAVPDIFQAQRVSHQPLQAQAFTRAGDTLLGSGELVLVNNQIDTATGTVQLKARFPNPAHALWPGQFVNVRLLLGHRVGALTVPDTAVQRGQDGTYAYVVDAGRTARSQPIQVAQVQDGVAVISQGVSAGERVVVAGQYKLKPGAAVTEAGEAAKPAQKVAENTAERQAEPAPGAAK